MNLELERVLKLEELKLKELLKLLDKQHELILSKNLFELEAIVEEIQIKNKEIAQVEVERRKILGGISIKEYILKSNEKDLDEVYRRINKLLNEMVLQNDTNELLIKQQLTFTNKLINIMTPKKEAAIYNSYGKIKK